MVPEVGEPPVTVKVPVGVKVSAPLGATVTGPERFKVVVVAALTADATMVPVPVRVPPCGPETLKELLVTDKVPEPELRILADVAVKLNALVVKVPG